MGKVRVAAFSISLDGFGAGVEQSEKDPLGKNGPELHKWYRETTPFRKMVGLEGGGADAVDEAFAQESMRDMGAWILGRNMFGPVRGAWPDDSWKGWWGDEPPYHVPTFVLTHHPRADLPMKGDTTFHFVTGGIHEALERARKVAGDRDIRIGGGVSTIQQYLRERLVDELHLAITPVLLGRGERFFGDLDLRSLGYACVESKRSANATHVRLAKT